MNFKQRWVEFHGEKCDVCGLDEDLQVHHTTYAHIFHEYMEDLQILCRGCHVQAHADLKKKPKHGQVQKL